MLGDRDDDDDGGKAEAGGAKAGAGTEGESHDVEMGQAEAPPDTKGNRKTPEEEAEAEEAEEKEGKRDGNDVDVEVEADVDESSNHKSGKGSEEKKKQKRKKKPQFTEFYDRLEVEYDASPEEIKRAYRKMALKLHPDKGGDTDKFHEMKRMADVLKDEDKRKAYDKYGPEFVKIMEGEAGTDEYIAALLQQSMSFRLLVFTAAVLLLGFVITFPLLLSARWELEVDSNASDDQWNWAIVFIPVWLVHISTLYGVYKEVATLELRDDLRDDPDSVQKFESYRKRRIHHAILLTIATALAVASEALIAVRLEGTVSLNWYIVLLPWIVLEVVLVLWHIHQGKPRYEDSMEKHRESGESLPPSVKSIILVHVFWPIVRFVQLFIIASKANGDTSASWFAVATPIYIGFVLYMYIAYSIAREQGYRQAIGETDLEEGNYRELTSEEDQQTWLKAVNACTTFCCVGLIFLISLLLACEKLDDPDSFSAYAIWSPLFIIVSCSFITVFHGIFCMRHGDEEDAQKSEGATASGGNQEPGQPQPTSNGGQASAQLPGQGDYVEEQQQVFLLEAHTEVKVNDSGNQEEIPANVTVELPPNEGQLGSSNENIEENSSRKPVIENFASSSNVETTTSATGIGDSASSSSIENQTAKSYTTGSADELAKGNAGFSPAASDQAATVQKPPPHDENIDASQGATTDDTVQTTDENDANAPKKTGVDETQLQLQ